MRHYRLLIVIALICMSIGCREKRQHPLQGMTNSEMKELLIESSKYHARQEGGEIDEYIEQHGLQMDESPTGLRYKIFTPRNTSCDSLKPEDRVTLDYRIFLLDGTLCYSSEKSGAKSFIVDRDDVESGLHEGVKYLCSGDSAMFILPSYHAHGLTGDHAKIPSNSPVIYYLRVLDVQ